MLSQVNDGIDGPGCCEIPDAPGAPQTLRKKIPYNSPRN